MKIVPQDLAMAVYNCHAEILRGKELLEQVEAFIAKPQQSPLQDVFGRSHDNLEMGIPSGEGSRRLIRLSPTLGKHIIVSHIATMEAKLVELSQAVLIHLNSTRESAHD